MAEDYAELLKELNDRAQEWGPLDQMDTFETEKARYKLIWSRLHRAITALLAERDALRAEKAALIEVLLAAVPNAADLIAQIRSFLNQGGGNG